MRKDAELSTEILSESSIVLSLLSASRVVFAESLEAVTFTVFSRPFAVVAFEFNFEIASLIVVSSSFTSFSLSNIFPKTFIFFSNDSK